MHSITELYDDLQDAIDMNASVDRDPMNYSDVSEVDMSPVINVTISPGVIDLGYGTTVEITSLDFYGDPVITFVDGHSWNLQALRNLAVFATNLADVLDARG